MEEAESKEGRGFVLDVCVCVCVCLCVCARACAHIIPATTAAGCKSEGVHARMYEMLAPGFNMQSTANLSGGVNFCKLHLIIKGRANYS